VDAISQCLRQTVSSQLVNQNIDSFKDEYLIGFNAFRDTVVKFRFEVHNGQFYLRDAQWPKLAWRCTLVEIN
jgi:hypothetical protein